MHAFVTVLHIETVEGICAKQCTHIHYFLWIRDQNIACSHHTCSKKTFLGEVEENSLHLGFYLFLFQHDAQMDYYGTHLATCSSDRTVKIFDVRNGGQILVADLRG